MKNIPEVARRRVEPILILKKGERSRFEILPDSQDSPPFHRGLETQLHTIADIQALPEGAEWCHVVGIDAVQAVRFEGSQSLSGFWRHLKSGHVHSVQTMTAHRRTHSAQHDTQVFSHHANPVSPRFQSEDGISFLDR